MKPAMHGLTIAWGTKPTDLKIGDIVVYSRPGQLGGLCHRIIDKNKDGNYLIKGDNAPEIDVISPKKIYYKVVKYKNYF